MPPNNASDKRNKWSVGGVRVLFIFVFIILVAFLGFNHIKSHASVNSSVIKTTSANICLDLYHDNDSLDVVDGYGCNGTQSQTFTFNDTTITHDRLCLGIDNNATNPGADVKLAQCDTNNAGQVWLPSGSHIINPNSQLCLSISSSSGTPSTIEQCSNYQDDSLMLATTSGNSINYSCSGSSEGQKVACQAVNAWVNWNSPGANHEKLLYAYTDQAPYEEWCADFVSYVYMKAGYPFTQGNSDGWDENIAGQIQYMGLTMHSASNYIPKTGDIAYFDYPGGHVEIVASGGTHPTFIYGDSGTTDPTTGNGEMAANTITSKPNEGQLIYYLSPN